MSRAATSPEQGRLNMAASSENIARTSTFRPKALPRSCAYTFRYMQLYLSQSAAVVLSSMPAVAPTVEDSHKKTEI
jgi:hypothetical protein